MGPRLVAAERDDLSRRIEHIDWGLWLDPQSEHRPTLDGELVEKQIVAVQVDRHAERPLRGGDARHVIDMRVGQQDMSNGQRLALDERQEALNLVSRVDERGFTRALAGDDEAVLKKRGDRLRLDYHSDVMILVVVDDLMFTSKIRAAATQAGVTLVFARSAEAALNEIRKEAPALVIFDLNNPRTDPMGTVAAMKRDTALSSIPTVGFVSHVDGEVIAAARSAGVGEVMARSAFTARLGDILSEYA